MPNLVLDMQRASNNSLSMNDRPGFIADLGKFSCTVPLAHADLSP